MVFFYPITSRWMDINNAPVVGYVVNSNCQFKKPVAYPDSLEGGVRVIRIGNRSVTYELGLFRNGDVDPAALERILVC